MNKSQNKLTMDAGCYSSPSVNRIDIAVEQGFAVTGGLELPEYGYEDGGDF